jgi:TolA-binding protein
MTEDGTGHPWWLQGIIAPAISSILIGSIGAYMGARVALARHDERLSELRERTTENRERIEQTEQQVREMQTLIDTRLTRLQTKIDLLLDNKLDVSTDNDSP